MIKCMKNEDKQILNKREKERERKREKYNRIEMKKKEKRPRRIKKGKTFKQKSYAKFQNLTLTSSGRMVAWTNVSAKKRPWSRGKGKDPQHMVGVGI